ncbi:MAG TPA: hypothetical protein PK668_04235 [Myxococcota bacterium]|nr:hypothetical protein [Myxococcota bacterium]HRY92068.1 hypothetical protein [Myxococcota bacterium]HSA22329.1 hypothetical protein [Myxococcota bacterium]
MKPSPLLVIDNALDHDFYRPLGHWTAAAGFAPDCVHPVSGQALPEPGLHRAVILTGSEASICERAPWAEAEAAWVREAARRGARILGSCWGHQLIAYAFAGPRAVRRSATPEFGWLEVQVDCADELLPAAPFACWVSHFDEVVPGCHPELQLLARSPGCAVQALRWGALAVWGVQAHPEVGPEEGAGFLRGSISRWPAQRADFERALAGPVRDSRVAPALVKRLLGERR